MLKIELSSNESKGLALRICNTIAEWLQESGEVPNSPSTDAVDVIGEVLDGLVAAQVYSQLRANGVDESDATIAAEETVGATEDMVDRTVSLFIRQTLKRQSDKREHARRQSATSSAKASVDDLRRYENALWLAILRGSCPSLSTNAPTNAIRRSV